MPRRLSSSSCSRAHRPQDESGELTAPLSDEALEALLIETEQRHEHRACGEWKDAQREEIDDELIGGDRPEAPVHDAGVELLAQARDHLRADVLGGHADDGRQQLAYALGMMVQLADQ